MISFIIPAYNASEYLERATESIIGDGTYNEDVEIVIVENGSTDNTTEIAEKLALSHKNIRVIHSEKGVSNARNMGVAHANGEWIAFLDADDRLVEQAIDIMLRDIEEKKSDLFLYGHEKGDAFVRLNEGDAEVIYQEDSIMDFRVMMLENPTKYMQVWAKLFKRDLILRNHIVFDSKLRLSEDSDFTLQYSRECKLVYVSPAIIYHYTIDNISTIRGNKEDKINDYVLAMNRTFEKIKGEDKRIVDAFQKYILMHLNIALVRDVFCVSNPVSFGKKIARMKEVAQEDVFKNAISFVKIKECMSPRMIPILGMKLHFYWISGMVYALRAYMNNKREKRISRRLP